MAIGQEIRFGSRSNFGEFFGDKAAAGLRGIEERFAGLDARFLRNIQDTSQERRALSTGVSSTIASKFRSTGGGPRGFASQLSQAERKAKARAGITVRGDHAIRNQQLKDRMQQAKQAGNRVGQIIPTIGNAQNLNTAIKFANEDADDIRAQAMAGAIGSTLGGVVGGAASSGAGGGFDFSLPTASTVEEADKGTAGADLFNNTTIPPLTFAEQLQPLRAA